MEKEDRAIAHASSALTKEGKSNYRKQEGLAFFFERLPRLPRELFQLRSCPFGFIDVFYTEYFARYRNLR